MTLIELAVVVIVLGTLMSIAVAAMFRARMSANEGAAISGLRTIGRAQFQYQSTCGNGLYAATLVVLGTNPGTVTEPYLPGDLGSELTPTRAGYVFGLGAGSGGAVGPNDCNGTPTVSSYYSSARPSDGQTGRRSFATTQAGPIWEVPGLAPPAEPFGAPARMVQ